MQGDISLVNDGQGTYARLITGKLDQQTRPITAFTIPRSWVPLLEVLGSLAQAPAAEPAHRTMSWYQYQNWYQWEAQGGQPQRRATEKSLSIFKQAQRVQMDTARKLSVLRYRYNT